MVMGISLLSMQILGSYSQKIQSSNKVKHRIIKALAVESSSSKGGQSSPESRTHPWQGM